MYFKYGNQELNHLKKDFLLMLVLLVYIWAIFNTEIA